MRPDARIARIAERQHSVLTHAQATTSGLTQEMINGRLRSGRWKAEHRGIYLIAGAPATLESRALAASLATRGVISHRTAGALWGFDGISQQGIDVLVSGHRFVRARGVVARRTRTLRRSDVTKMGVIPITTPLRTLIDLASVLSKHELEDAFDSALRRYVGLDRIRARLAGEQHGVRGAATLRRLVASRVEQQPSGSRPENRVRRALTRSGLPAPARQYEIFDNTGCFVARVDLAYPDAHVYIEYDGAAHATPEQLEIDNERQNRLTELGWVPLRFTKGSLRRADERIIERVRAVLRSRSGL